MKCSAIPKMTGSHQRISKSFSIACLLLMLMPCLEQVNFAESFDPENGSDQTIRQVRNAALSDDSVVLNALFGERSLAENIKTVQQRAGALTPSDRVALLHEWVLPRTASDEFRVVGRFSPLCETVPFPDSSDRNHIDRSDIESPVYDLIDSAREMNGLDELRRRVERANVARSARRRIPGVVMLALIDYEKGDRESAATLVSEVQSLMAGVSSASLFEQWPGTLLVDRALRKFEAANEIEDLVAILLSRESRWAPPGAWRSHVRSLAARLRHIQLGGTNESFEAAITLAAWTPATLMRSWSDEGGHAQARTRWHRQPDGSIAHQASHNHDYLLLRTPLRGDFSIDGEITSETQILAAGHLIGPHHDLAKFYSGTFRSGARMEPLEKPFTVLSQWNRFRVVFEGDICRYFLSGRKVYEMKVSKYRDPWIGFRSLWGPGHGVRHLKLSGNPKIVEQVNLSADESLAGWTSWNPEGVNTRGATWNHRSVVDGPSEIIGMRQPWRDGPRANSLLTYHRPVSEDGSIEYEFFYEPGRRHTHPALGRIAFLLTPDSVFPHWIVGYPADHSGLPSDNSLRGVGNTLGAGKLPLQIGEWNRVKLTLAESTLSIALNSQPIFKGAINPSSGRTFGLFHFAENSEVRVRNVLMSGAWPRSVVKTAQLEFGDTTLAMLDESRKALPVHIEHDFAKQGLPEDLFLAGIADGAEVAVTGDGVSSSISTKESGGTSEIAARVELSGNFDIEAEFDKLNVDGKKYACILMQLKFDDSVDSTVRILRMRDNECRQISQVQTTAIRNGQWTLASSNPVGNEATHGRLRIARRGSDIHLLMSESLVGGFQHVGTHQIPKSTSVVKRVSLEASCGMESTAAVVWKRLRISSDEVTMPQTIVSRLNEERSTFETVFRHDFASDRLPDRLFRFVSREWISEKPEGAVVEVTADGTLAGGYVTPEVTVSGDFDIEATFRNLKLSGQSHASILLFADPEVGPQLRTVRLSEDRGNYIRGSWWRAGREQLIGQEQSQTAQAQSGKLRLARRGKEMYSLFSPGTTGKYILIGHRIVEESDGPTTQLGLLTFCTGQSSASVVWKDMTIKVELAGDKLSGGNASM